MRLLSYHADGNDHVGVRTADGGIAAVPGYGSMLELLDAGDAGLDAARGAAAGSGSLDAAAVKLLPVVPNPRKIICVARNYGKHAAEAGFELHVAPSLFIRFARSLIADGDPIIVPRVSVRCDWEAELALVIGKEAKHVAKEDAYSVIAGYTIFNDVSIRDWQLRKPPIQFGAGKNFDGSGPLGPDLVTADEVANPHDLGITLTVNGETMQDANTEEMLFDIPTLIEHISTFTTLEPGDIIATGTPAGVGNFREPPLYLKAGDVVRIEIDQVGVQQNPVADES